MKDFAGLMKQAQKMQEDLAKAQEELEQREVEGSAGAGLVRVTLNGKGEARGLVIDDSLMKPDEKEVLEDLLIAAMNDAKRKVDEAAQETMRSAAGGLGNLGDLLPPGFKLPL